ncbi:unnamed protein product [Schistocephalus solidus]|uniref:Sodium/hydrogen exchanger n=1 Tax=Schistocephalus solidus TaxID=70667 RepID=A0A183STX9_SCHSO|nr:unnamed protein product [Schistocephalus solidus]
MKSCHFRLGILILLSLPIFGHDAVNATSNSSQRNITIPVSPKPVLVADWRFGEYSRHVTAIIFVLCIVMVKTYYGRIPFVSELIPESMVLIVLGVCFGCIVRFACHVDIETTVWNLCPELFFEFLLPPIVLESAYCLYNRTFGEYLGIILVYAVCGTILNFFIIGFVMYGLDVAGAMGPNVPRMDIKVYLLFASMIVAVDPVAVLAIFQDIGVDLSLYYMVFGESLLNDAVTVVLYKIMSAFCSHIVVEGSQIATGFVSFFSISIGGLLIGIFFGVLTSLITRFGIKHEVTVTILLGYFAYIIADMVAWSGIISMISCGLVQAAYAFDNMNRKAVKAIRAITEESATICEAIIFVLIGIQLLNVSLAWQNGFCLWGITLCLVSRLIVVMVLTFAINMVRVDNRKVSFTEQIILIYGGLRGAVALALALLIDQRTLGPLGEHVYDIIVTTVLLVILVTVCFMGVTMKPLVRLLKIKLEGQKSVSILMTLNQSIFDHTLACIESISGNVGRNHLRQVFLDLDDRYIRRVLQRDPETRASKLVRVYEKIALKLHYASIQQMKSSVHLDKLPALVKEQFYRQMNTTSSWSLDRLDSTDSESQDPGGKTNCRSGKEGTDRVFRSILRTKKPQDGEVGEINIRSEVQQAKRVCFKPGTRRQSEFSEDLLKAIRSKAIMIQRRATISAENPATVEFQPKLHTLSEQNEDESSNALSFKKPSYELGAPVTSRESDSPQPPLLDQRQSTGGI